MRRFSDPISASLAVYSCGLSSRNNFFPQKSELHRGYGLYRTAGYIRYMRLCNAKYSQNPRFFLGGAL